MSDDLKDTGLKTGLAIIAVILVVGLFFAYQQVPEGYVGVEKNWGAVNGNVLDSGANWIIPFMQAVQDVETRPRTYTMSQTVDEGERRGPDAITVKTINGTSVQVDITVRYHVETQNADSFVEEWNNERQMERRLIRPTIRSVLRDEASSLETTGENSIYTREGRQSLQKTAKQALEREFEGQSIVLEAVQVRNIDLPSNIDQTLQEKEQAKQQVQVEREKIKQEEAKAQQNIVEAEGDAEAIEIRGEALSKNEIVLRQESIDAVREAETVYVPTDSGLTLTREIKNNTAD